MKELGDHQPAGGPTGPSGAERAPVNVGSGEAARPGDGRHRAPSPAWLLAVQRSAGNRAAGLAVQRWAPGSRLARLDELLDALIVSRSAVLEALEGLNVPEKAAVVSGYRDRLARVLSASQMVRAVRALNPPLPVKLDWVRAASLMVALIDYRTIKPLITTASQPERDALNTPAWRSFITSVCNNDSIVEAVIDLRFPLPVKLGWLVDEADPSVSLNVNKVRPVLMSGTSAERAAAAGAAFHPLWRLVCTPPTTGDLARILLPDDLGAQLRLMHAIGAGYADLRNHVIAAPAPQRITLYVDRAMTTTFLPVWSVLQLLDMTSVIGGDLGQQLGWLLAKPVPPFLLLPRIAGATPAERSAALTLPVVRGWVQALPDPMLGLVMRAFDVTPAENMAVFGATRPITSLTWATPSQEWVDAIAATRTNPMDVLTAAGANMAWAPFIRTRLADLFRGRTETVHGAAPVAMVWAAYGDGSTFDAPDSLVVFRALYGRPVMAAGTPLIFTKTTTTRERYNVVTPNDATARQLMAMVRPLGRSQVAISPIAFSDKYWDETQRSGRWRGPQRSVNTSFFWQNKIVIRASATGQMDTAIIDRDHLGGGTAYGGGSTTTAANALTYFQNHVRHEIGHAVGANPIGTMSESGNRFADRYGDWQWSSAAQMTAAFWTAATEPATGWPSLDFGGGAKKVTDDQVRAWLIGLLANGTQAAGPIRSGTKSIPQKIATISGSTLWGSQLLTKYLAAIVSEGAASPAQIRDSAYMFPGFTPPAGRMHIFGTRTNNRFVSYSTAAFDKVQPGTGWYAMSSPPEMFAEIYTRKYSGGGVPVAVNGKDWSVFFTQLEAQEDPMFGAPAAPATTPSPAPAGTP